MRRALLGALTAAALLAGGAGGAAHAQVQPGVYDAMLLPAAGSASVGAAALVDLPADDTLVIGMQRLVPGGTYAVQVHETEVPGDPCLTPAPHAPHEGWPSTTVVADADGLGVGFATTAGFTLHGHRIYWVDVATPDGAVVACGMLLPRPA